MTIVPKSNHRAKPAGQDLLAFWNEAMVFPPNAGPVAVRPPDTDQPEAPMHSHAFAELVIVTGGTGIHAVGKLRYSLTPGDVFIIMGRQRHAYENVHRLRLVNIAIRNPFLGAHRCELIRIGGGRILFGSRFQRSRLLSPQELEDCLRIVERLRQEQSTLQDGSGLMQKTLLMELLVTVCRLAEKPSKIEDIHAANIAKALQFLEHHYAGEIGLGELARAAGMSLRSFHRHFKASTGMTPAQHLLRQRIAAACRLLRETAAPVQAVAADCGIPDPVYFCRIFRKMTGMPPGAFRRFR